MKCSLQAMGVWGPGFDTVEGLQACLADPGLLVDAKSNVPKPELIPKNERRRAPLLVRLGVEVSSQCFANSGMSPADAACVFASGEGDTSITDYMCRAVATADKLLSPTKFHNSVHNAAAGYWTISADCMQAATSVAAFDKTVPLALLEAASQVQLEQRPVLLTVFDAPAPDTLKHPLYTSDSFAAALLLGPPQQAGGSASESKAIAQLDINLHAGSDKWPALAYDGLHALYTSNPAARILPLLAGVIAGGDESLSFPASAGSSVQCKVQQT